LMLSGWHRRLDMLNDLEERPARFAGGLRRRWRL
jgi:hypothetical protein